MRSLHVAPLATALLTLALGCGDDDATSSTSESGSTSGAGAGTASATGSDATSSTAPSSSGGTGAEGPASTGPGGGSSDGGGSAGDGGQGGAGDTGGGGTSSGNAACPLPPLPPDEPVVVTECEVVGVELSGAIELRTTPFGELLARDGTGDWARLVPAGDEPCPLVLDAEFGEDGRYPAEHGRDASGRFFRLAALGETVAVYISDADGHGETMVFCPADDDVALIRPNIAVTDDGSTIYVDDEIGTDIVVTVGDTCSAAIWTPPWTAQVERDDAGPPRGVHVAFDAMFHVAQFGLYVHDLDGSPIGSSSASVCSLGDASITACQVDIPGCGMIHRFGVDGSLAASVSPTGDDGEPLPLESPIRSFARTPFGAYATRQLMDGVVFHVDGM